MSSESNRRASLAYYHRNKEVQKAGVQLRIAKLRDRVATIKEASPCVDCGQFYRSWQMDFDHTSNNKIKGVAQMVNAQAQWDVIEEEMAKCDLVCANCHRTRTFNRSHEYK